jgi:hypothetical protein
MNTGFPAILTPQLNGTCSDIQITEDEESWIGRKKYSYYSVRRLLGSLLVNIKMTTISE